MRSRVLLLALALVPVACADGDGDVSLFDDDTSGTSPGDPRLPPSEPSSGCRGVALPDDGHFAPDGLCASAVATNMGRLRQITFAGNGDLFGVTADGIIYKLRDVDGDGFYGLYEILSWARIGAERGANNVVLDEAGGFLYASGDGFVKRFAYSPSANDGGIGVDVIVDLPKTGTHVTHTVKIHDGFLYVHSGSENNFVAPKLPDYDTERAVIKRFPLARIASTTEPPLRWSEGEVFARGLRNTVGYTFDAEGRLHAVNNGIDHLTYEGRDVHQDNPAEELFVVEQNGAYGYPYCFSAMSIVKNDGTRVEPGTFLKAQATENAALPAPPAPATFQNPHDDAWCAANAKPARSLFFAHTAPLDIALVDPATSRMPAPYNEGAFVALHGSWNRDIPTGFRVVHVKPGAKVVMPSDRIFGPPEDGDWSWAIGGVGETLVRPVGVAISPIDGALYISSDNAPVQGRATTAAGKGAIYRVGPRVPNVIPE